MNARYLLADYQASIRAKNDFILVAVRNAAVVGFVQYCFQHYAAPAASSSADGKADKGRGRGGGGRSSASLRPSPKPVAYVATLQTAQPSSHADYLTSCAPAPPDAAEPAAAPSAASPAAAAAGVGPCVVGAEPRTGVVLMALAVAHAHRDGKHLLFCDSTPDAAPFYRRFFGMEACLPVRARARLLHPARTGTALEAKRSGCLLCVPKQAGGGPFSNCSLFLILAPCCFLPWGSGSFFPFVRASLFLFFGRSGAGPPLRAHVPGPFPPPAA